MCHLDFPIMLSRLKKAGVSFEDLAKETGLHSSRFRQIESERKPIPKAWQEAATIIDIYLKYVQTNVPMLYDGNEE